MRLDLYLVQKGFAESRERAKTLIKSGAVAVDGRIITKSAEDIPTGQITPTDGSNTANIPAPEIEILSPLKYVSRGGYKLEFALDSFSVFPKDKICMDIGASTGGFTDCLLQRGARRVYAVDVGTAQLHPTLFADPRVISLEQSDFRTLEFSGEAIDLFVCDVSFISVTKILPGIFALMGSGSSALILIKPQFEGAGYRKNGVIKDKRERLKAVTNVVSEAEAFGFAKMAVKECPFTGKDGNVEYFLYVNV
ncbi:MAG: TlyA family RNA methyltransferase [Ruminococcus sp.]|jgi:23S rRNA (cytidine1920-2'-O)/16S rRNA (cytidine1409-2'-O)-methyltransferase|nr:TlyA family RNA methyltransferase [Ruminococcus sp.]